MGRRTKRLRVGERDVEADGAVGGGDDYNDDDEGECEAQDNESGDVFPLWKASMDSRTSKSRASASTTRCGKKAVGGGGEAEGDGEGEGPKLLVGGAHGRPHQGDTEPGCATADGGPRVRSDEAEGMKVGERVQEGALLPGRVWEGGLFQLSAKERLARGFNFNMDRAAYEEIKVSTARSHTIHPQNVTDTDRAGGVQLPSGSFGGPESVHDGDAGGDGNDEVNNSTRGCSQTMGSPGGVRKRKNMRQQTFEALTECMEKHGTLMASTMESASKRQCSIQIRQCEAMEAELEVKKKHYAASDEVSKMMCHVMMEIAKAIRDRSLEAAIAFLRPLAHRDHRAHVAWSSFPQHFMRLDRRFCHHLTIVRDNYLIVAFDFRYDFSPPCLHPPRLSSSTMTNSRSAGQGKRGRDALEKDVPVVEKKGRHQAKKRKAVAAGPSNVGNSVRDEWVSDSESTEEDDAIESGEEEAAARKGSLRTRSALKINDAGAAQAAHHPRGGEARAQEDVVIDVDADVAPREVRGMASNAEVRTAGALSRTLATAPPEGDRSVRAPSSPVSPRQPAAPRTTAMEVQGGRAGVGSSRAARGAGAGEGRGDGDDDDPLVNRQRRGYVKEGIEAATRLWVDDLRFWNEMEGHGLYKLIQEARLYLLAIARGVQPPVIRRSIALPHITIPQHKVEDESELKATKERATRVQSITLCIIHGWIFKSASRSLGYHAAYGYMLNHVTADIAHAMWCGEDWRTCISPAVIHNTLELGMKLHVWFVGANIEDRHEDDELAFYQEASVQRVVGALKLSRARSAWPSLWTEGESRMRG
ncbi:hypothetical protein CBR_g23550 [Chara braunii]|uniref:Uncharacterized protein n=1 Tax=Chara braunii TaxID=69332 RepID=A0A388L4U7_CHABU|nr:hypothetical protein CBR_g23550 [Chara braunii]|eukprot:GBG77223.1 hypothetical protein CBR_g23550 [Chara braunii]